MEAIDEMDEVMVTQFKDMFEKINQELNSVFKSLFGGGRARLFMVDPQDVLNTGIDIDVPPPGSTKYSPVFRRREKFDCYMRVVFHIKGKDDAALYLR